MIKKIFLGLVALLAIGAGVLYLTLPPFNMPLATFKGGIDVDAQTLSRKIETPAGFRFTQFATGLRGARSLRATLAGDLLLSVPKAGEVVLLGRDADGNGQSDNRKVLLRDLDRPNGLELANGWLYVAEASAIGRVLFDAQTRETKGAYSRIVTGLPGDGNHTKKTLRMGPDGWLYFNVGSSCNVCVEKDARRGTLMRVSPDGSRSEIHATGLRNSMGFDWSPRDGALYATENARDLLGDDYPPEELNRIEPGKFYGWPYINARGDADPDFGKQLPQGTVATDPAHAFAAHNAPLGLTFLRSGAYPAEFHHDALVALHGSWNRSKKDGYKVVRLSWDTDGKITQRDFMTGFLLNDNVIGRPVDVVEAPDGSIYVSDDFNGSVYRLAYGEAGQSARLPATTPEPVQRTLRPTITAEVERQGQALFSRNRCETCHGEPATLAKTLVPLKDLATRHDRGSLVALFKAPPSSMPPVPLGNAELEVLADFLLATR